MKWIEVIQLRSMDRNRKRLKSKLQSLIKDVDKGRNKLVILSYSRVFIETDFCIHLFHDSKKVENGGSPLGLLLANELKEFGLVNHSLWVQMHGK